MPVGGPFGGSTHRRFDGDVWLRSLTFAVYVQVVGCGPSEQGVGELPPAETGVEIANKPATTPSSASNGRSRFTPILVVARGPRTRTDFMSVPPELIPD